MVAGRLRQHEEHLRDRSGNPNEPLLLEIVRPGDGGCISALPMRLRNLSAQGVTVEIPGRAAGEPLPELAGRSATLCLPAGPEGGLTHIPATVRWAREQNHDGREGLLVGLELAEPSLRIRQALEAHLPQYPRDLKGLWDHWDRTQEEQVPAPPVVLPLTPPSLAEPPRRVQRADIEKQSTMSAEDASDHRDLPIYLVALASVAVGLLLFTFGPESLQAFGAILAIYGSVAMAGRSMWTMWQRLAAKTR